MILSFLLAILIIFLTIFSLGSFLASKLLPKFSSAEKLIVGAFLGFSFNASLIALAGLLINTTSYYLLILTSFLGLLVFKDFQKNLKKLLKVALQNKKALIFLILATASLASSIVFSGVVKNDRLEFQEIHDSVWHLALIKELKADFPPSHPSFNKIGLAQYHYFYDLIIAGISKITSAPSTVLFFQVFPIIISGLLVSSAGLLGRALNKKYGFAWLVFLTAFTGSFAYLIPIFIPGNSWSESSFWVSQTFAMMVNPQVILTLGLTYTVMLVILKSKTINWKNQLLLIALIAPSIGFKSYSWVILSPVYASFLAWDFFSRKNKKWEPILYGLAYLLVSLPFLWLVTAFKSGSFIYLPLWYLSSMVEISDRLNLVEWTFEENHYRMKGNWLRVWEIKIKELLIFYFGNLGIRSVFLGLIPLAFLKKISSRETRFIFISLVGFLVATIFPLIFLQRGTVWNSIQFWYYGLIFANILSAMVLSKISNKLSSSGNTFLWLVVIALAVPAYLKTTSHKLTNREGVNLEFIKTISAYSPSDTVLICHEGTIFYDTSLISAFSPARVYLANPGQLELVEASITPASDLQKIFETADVDKLMSIIQENEINKLVCSDGNRNETLSSLIEKYSDYNFQIENFDNLKVYSLSKN